MAFTGTLGTDLSRPGNIVLGGAPVVAVVAATIVRRPRLLITNAPSALTVTGARP